MGFFPYWGLRGATPWLHPRSVPPWAVQSAWQQLASAHEILLQAFTGTGPNPELTSLRGGRDQPTPPGCPWMPLPRRGRQGRFTWGFQAWRCQVLGPVAMVVPQPRRHHGEGPRRG